MSLLDDFPAAWRTDVTVTGPVHRTPDGYLAAPGAPVAVRGCLVATWQIGRASCRERV